MTEIFPRLHRPDDHSTLLVIHMAVDTARRNLKNTVGNTAIENDPRQETKAFRDRGGIFMSATKGGRDFGEKKVNLVNEQLDSKMADDN